jgi:hypothetical protein
MMTDAAHKSRNILNRRLFRKTNMIGYAVRKVTVHKGLL